MEENKTKIQLLKEIHDCEAKHERLKTEIIDDTYRIDEISTIITVKIEEVTEVEKKYVELIEMYNNLE